jgi:hypothetical protein
MSVKQRAYVGSMLATGQGFEPNRAEAEMHGGGALRTVLTSGESETENNLPTRSGRRSEYCLHQANIPFWLNK